MRIRPLLIPLVACACLLGAALTPAARAADTSPSLLAYKLLPGTPVRYKLTAHISGSVPMFQSPTPVDINDLIVTMVYSATPKTLLPDGSTEVDFAVESADVELEKVPFPVPLEQAQQILNQTVTLSKTGEVLAVKGGAPLPFGVSVPGVEPKRLYTLLFPIVFPTRPVAVGDAWNYKSEFLGGEGAPASFSARVLPPETATRPAAGKKGSKQPVLATAPSTKSPASTTRLGETFSMNVDQKVDVNKKPVTDASQAHRSRKGRIDGNGVFNFDRNAGLFTSGSVNVNARLQDDLIGQPSSEDEPKQVVSKVKAKVFIKLLPAAETASTSK